ncbi:hypothetical protein CDAR_313951 [Caerostris darwini]|uniref:Uncharacterized protein n=1 Tax=Caerostris darwini TaxID=1538125 RepID=A0AAV4TE11_9ARAC|nr:hypothetical protein CDAR_313951 [Caerostris darwini]
MLSANSNLSPPARWLRKLPTARQIFRVYARDFLGLERRERGSSASQCLPCSFRPTKLMPTRSTNQMPFKIAMAQLHLYHYQNSKKDHLSPGHSDITY